MEDLQANDEVIDEKVEEVEQMIPQSQVNKLIGGIKAKQKEKISDYENRLAEMQEQQKQKQYNDAHNRDSTQLNIDSIYQDVRERLNREVRQEEMAKTLNNVAENYTSRIDAGKGDFEDFDEVFEDFDVSEFPELVVLTHDNDNAAGIMYELAKNPSKLATIHYLAKVSPRKAKAELIKLGKSIAENRSIAKDSKEAAEPLDRMNPTNRNALNSNMTVSDLRKQDYLRG